MELNDKQLANTQEEVQQQDTITKPNAYRVDTGLTDEAGLSRNYASEGEVKDAKPRGMEGEGMGGHQFGGTSNPPTGDDPANPSRNAGYTNAYFARTEPSEEWTEDNNFKSQKQQGEPIYQTATSSLPEAQVKESKSTDELNTGKADYKEEDQSSPDYQSDAPEIPGPNEVAEQQKVGGA